MAVRFGFFYDFAFKMSETGKFQSRGRRNKKKRNLESILAEALSLSLLRKLVISNLVEEKKRKTYVSFFSRNPVTGERSTHCKYRPR